MPNRNQFKNNEEYNTWFREYRNKKGEFHRRYNREYIKVWRSKYGFKASERSILKYPDKTKARSLLRYAIKTGRIIRGVCEVCRGTDTQGHHEDYSKPLAVRWFCHLHHAQQHKKISTVEN